MRIKTRTVGNLVVENSTVETPLHIGELMRGLVGVNADSILYDCCAGRGNLIKDAGCTTIAVEKDERFKSELEKNVTHTIIEDCVSTEASKEIAKIARFKAFNKISVDEILMMLFGGNAKEEYSKYFYSKEEFSKCANEYFTDLQISNPVQYTYFTDTLVYYIQLTISSRKEIINV